MMLQGRSFTAARPVARTRATSVRVQAATTSTGKLPKWDIMYDYLTTVKKLESIDPVDAEARVATGQWVLVDVRPPDAYKNARCAGAVNVPLFQPLDWSKPDLGKVLKFIAYSSNGVNPVELNPNFGEQINQVTNNGAKGVITICEAGGTLKPSTNFPSGKASRSLQAAYRVLAELGQQAAHLDRGVYGWYQADLPFEGEGEYSPELGRTPQGAAEPMLRIINQSTGYAVREGDKK